MNQSQQAVFQTKGGKSLFKPIWIVGHMPLVNASKEMKAGDHRMALYYVSELQEKRYSEIKLYATAEDGSTYQWGYVGSKGNWLDVLGMD